MNLRTRLISVIRNYWDLGFTAFGGPPVHFIILKDRFVKKLKWIDEGTYQELFAVCQSLPGPASTKLAYAISLDCCGFLPSLLAFALWSLPGALGMFGLALGIARVGDTLPAPVYYLLSGLNSATVGLIALAGMQLSVRAITDSLSRTVLIVTACAGLCYTALWYFPVLMAASGLTTVIWDLFLKTALRRFQRRLRSIIHRIRQRDSTSSPTDSEHSLRSVEVGDNAEMNNSSSDKAEEPSHSNAQEVDTRRSFTIAVLPGIIAIVLFFASFITLVVIRSVYAKYVQLRLFTNMVLAGTIIFGGGPVVIPLLREYVVQEGWVSSRDFLLGLAVIQAFPGPNFNFAVYLGALTASSTSTPRWVMALLAFVGIFAPGLILTTGISPLWSRLRRYRAVISCLRGINAAAIGLVWTAVYRLWEAGNLTPTKSTTMTNTGTSLGSDPWWIVVAAVSFSANEWYHLPAAVCIVLGGVLGIARWGVTH